MFGGCGKNLPASFNDRIAQDVVQLIQKHSRISAHRRIDAWSSIVIYLLDHAGAFSCRTLEALPGLVRVVAVGHDGSLYRASLPKPGPGQSPQTYIRQKARPLRDEAEARIVAIAGEQNFDKLAMARLISHATVSALARKGKVDYAHSIAGGSLVNLIRFGEDRMERLIAELVEWLTD